MGMWHGLRGRPKRTSGTSGAVTLASGTTVLQFSAVAGGSGATIQIGDDATAITVPANGAYSQQENHQSFVLQGSSSQRTITFTGTSAYTIEYVDPAGGVYA